MIIASLLGFARIYCSTFILPAPDLASGATEVSSVQSFLYLKRRFVRRNTNFRIVTFFVNARFLNLSTHAPRSLKSEGGAGENGLPSAARFRQKAPVNCFSRRMLIEEISYEQVVPASHYRRSVACS